ncbi:hypothetical protein SSX86_004070 [Deinandra increscens subsp. villosa]|uniref:TF-B3 domain-containing protein n=1 Tax=Deinandra increscens subsp. villosa TaxID=3103831 RepID=A0AAP0DJI6_9ASTR
MHVHEVAMKFAYQIGVKVLLAFGGAPINQHMTELSTKEREVWPRMGSSPPKRFTKQWFKTSYITMKIVNIEDIRNTDPEAAIEVRVIRRWSTRLTSDETSYIFVDKNGDGIHAIAAASYKQAYDAPLELLNCYRIVTFSCEDPVIYLKTVDHPVSLRFGSTATITTIPDSMIYPRLYFNFTKYEDLTESTEACDVYIDFIGLVDHIVDATTKDRDPYVRLFLKTERNTITVTLWKEIVTSPDRFNRAELDSTTRPCTVSLTAVKPLSLILVGWFQLTSTPATYTYINPVCPESAALLQSDNCSGVMPRLLTSLANFRGLNETAWYFPVQSMYHQQPTNFFVLLMESPIHVDTYEFAKVQYGNQQAAASVSLVFTTNMFWDIKIKRIGEDVYMMNGWSQVVKDIPLRENHFLEFIYASDSVVRLHVYSEDGSNILSVPTAVKSESESNYSAE